MKSIGADRSWRSVDPYLYIYIYMDRYMKMVVIYVSQAKLSMVPEYDMSSPRALHHAIHCSRLLFVSSNRVSSGHYRPAIQRVCCLCISMTRIIAIVAQ